jgi:peptidyl-prolyl cis-trans isomerase SurA
MKRIFAFIIFLHFQTVFAENTIIAIVNNDVISFKYLESQILESSNYDEKVIVVENRIDTILQLNKAKELGIYASEEDTNFALKDIATENNISLLELQSYPEFLIVKREAAEKISILNLQRLITKNLKKTDNNRYSKCHKDSDDKNIKQIKIAQIFISDIETNVKNSNQKDEKIKVFLMKLSNHIQKGASFEVFAKLYSQHPSYTDGGITDWITVDNPTYMMLDSLEKNKVSEIYTTDFGFAIAIKIDERYISSAVKKCKEKLLYIDAKKYYSNWIKELRRDAYIEIFYDKI